MTLYYTNVEAKSTQWRLQLYIVDHIGVGTSARIKSHPNQLQKNWIGIERSKLVITTTTPLKGRHISEGNAQLTKLVRCPRTTPRPGLRATEGLHLSRTPRVRGCASHFKCSQSHEIGREFAWRRAGVLSDGERVRH